MIPEPVGFRVGERLFCSLYSAGLYASEMKLTIEPLYLDPPDGPMHDTQPVASREHFENLCNQFWNWDEFDEINAEEEPRLQWDGKKYSHRVTAALWRMYQAAPPAPAAPEAISTRQAIANMERHELCGSINVAYKHGGNACRAAMLAQPVSQGKLPPHAYRELVNTLRDTAVKYSGTDQLRERLNTALSQFIEPDHPHTRSAAPEGGNG